MLTQFYQVGMVSSMQTITGATEAMERDNLIRSVNFLYNYDATRSYREYRHRLEHLSNNALHAIHDLITTAEDKEKRLLSMQFAQRNKYDIDKTERFAGLMGQEYVSVRDELRSKYTIDPTPVEIAVSVTGVMDFENKVQPLTPRQRHRAIIVLSACETQDSISTSNWFKGDYGNHAWINEDTFNDYVTGSNTDDYHHEVIAAVCSGSNYSRFIEVLETANGTITTQPLISGVL